MIASVERPCDVAILAGGLGTRLREVTGDLLPKAMVQLLGKPLLEHQIECCRQYGFKDIALLVHHSHRAISDHFKNGSSFGVRLRYLVEKAPRGTAGALMDALPHLAPTFLVLYGDTYLDVNLRALWRSHALSGAQGTLFLHPNDHPQDSDLVEVDDELNVLAIHPYPHPEGKALRNLVNAALYVFQKTGLQPHLPSGGKGDLAKDTFPSLLAAGQRLVGYITPEYIKDMGTPNRLAKVTGDILAGLPERLSGRSLRSAVFLDRDGTLNREVDHLTQPEDLSLLPGVPEAIRKLNSQGYLAVLATNQPVMARGQVTKAGLANIHARLDFLLGGGHAYLDAIYYCPHHPHRGFEGEVADLKIDCPCRKPDTGMVDQACRELKISRHASWFIGDSTSDIEAGRRADLRTILVRTGYAGRDGKYCVQPDFTAPGLAEAVQWILEGFPASRRKAFPLVAAHLDARIVLLGGLARSGKSSFARVLKELYMEAGRTAHVIAMDSWLLPVKDRTEGKGVHGRYEISGLETLARNLHERSNRQNFTLSEYDPIHRAQSPQTQQFSVGPDDVIILEGVPALTSPVLLQIADFRIHLQTDENIRMDRIRKDYAWRGVPTDEITTILESRNVDETPQISAAKASADEILLL